MSFVINGVLWLQLPSISVWECSVTVRTSLIARISIYLIFFLGLVFLFFCRFVSDKEQGSRVVLLLSTGPQVSKWAPIEPSHEARVLEGNRQGSQNQVRLHLDWNEEDSCLLHWSCSQREENQLGYARVPTHPQGAWWYQPWTGPLSSSRLLFLSCYSIFLCIFFIMWLWVEIGSF